MRVLFVCTGNTCRSPMAEGLLIRQLGQGSPHTVESAGVYADAGAPASSHAIIIMREFGVDLSGHRSRRLTDEMVRHADVVVTMTQSHTRAVLRDHPSSIGKVSPLSEIARLYGDIIDPFGGTIEDYRIAAADILARIEALAELLPELEQTLDGEVKR